MHISLPSMQIQSKNSQTIYYTQGNLQPLLQNLHTEIHTCIHSFEYMNLKNLNLFYKKLNMYVFIALEIIYTLLTKQKHTLEIQCHTFLIHHSKEMFSKYKSIGHPQKFCTFTANLVLKRASETFI